MINKTIWCFKNECRTQKFTLRNIRYTCQSTDRPVFYFLFLHTPFSSLAPFTCFLFFTLRILLAGPSFLRAYTSSPPLPHLPIVSFSLFPLISGSRPSSSFSITPLEFARGRASGLIANIISSSSHKRAAVRIWMTASAFSRPRLSTKWISMGMPRSCGQK